MALSSWQASGRIHARTQQWRDNLIMDRNLKLLARCFDSHGLSSNISLSRNSPSTFRATNTFLLLFGDANEGNKEKEIWWLDLYRSRVAHYCNANFHGNFFRNIYARNLHS